MAAVRESLDKGSLHLAVTAADVDLVTALLRQCAGASDPSVLFSYIFVLKKVSDIEKKLK